MNKKLEAISSAAADDLKALIRDKEEQILEAWSKAEEFAVDNETKPKFRLGYTITLDLDKDSQTGTLSWSIREKAEHTRPMPEPDQIPLPINN